jgi:hypothetical protein
MKNAIGFIYAMFLFGCIALVSLIGYIVYKLIIPSKVVMESKVLIKPDYKLQTDGNKIDTIYLYKFNQNK